MASQSCDSGESVEALQTKVFKKRWIILCLLCTVGMNINYNHCGYAQVSNIYVPYFKVSHAIFDWATIGTHGGMVLVTPVLAWLCYANFQPIRCLAITASALVCIDFACIVVANAYPQLFLAIVIGEIANGFCKVVTLSVASAFSVSWFPDSEVGTALGVIAASFSVGCGLGLLVPGQILKTPLTKLRRISNISSNATDDLEEWKLYDQHQMLKMNGTLLFISLVVLLLMVSIVTDAPPKPPTLAQAAKRTQIREMKSFNEFLQLCKKLFGDLTFWLLVVIYGVIVNSRYIELAMLQEIISEISDSLKLGKSSNVLGSYVMLFYQAGSIFGNLVSGKLVDKYKNYKRALNAGSLLMSLFGVGVFLSIYLTNYVALCVSNLLFGLAARICTVPILEMATQHTYPISESFVVTCLTGFQSVVSILMVEFGRVVFTYTRGVLGVPIFLCSCLFAGFGLTIAIKPRYNRLNMERGMQENQKILTENDPLLNNH